MTLKQIVKKLEEMMPKDFLKTLASMKDLMTNKEKYRFSDFTILNYKRLISLAKSNNFNFIGFNSRLCR